MTHTLPLSEVKMKFSRLIEDVVSKDDEIVITRNGKPGAVLVNASDFGSWKETQEIRADSELMGEIQKGLKALQGKHARKYTDLDKLFGPAA